MATTNEAVSKITLKQLVEKAHFTESLSELKGFKVAIDADLLLRKVNRYSVFKTLRESNISIDKELEDNLVEILQKLKSDF